jgi:thiol-disulfide isomerase/thioredoxin
VHARIPVLLSALGLGLALAAAPLDTEASELRAPEKRSKVAGFRLKDLSGKQVQLSDFAGKVVVVNFWATWCVPCIQELPHLDKLQARYGKDGLVVLAVTIDGPETFSRVRSVVQRRKWKMPVLLDQDGSVAGLLNPRGTNPYTMFVDRGGRLARDHEGYSSGDEVQHEATIKALLAEGAP